MSASATPARAAARARQVRERVNELADPCSVAAGDPVGLADLGLVTAIELDDDRVRVTVRPTFPGCMFVGVFEQEIRAAVASLPWCADVQVEIHSTVGWSEADMVPEARARLERRRSRARGAAQALRGPAGGDATGARWTS